MIFYDNEKEAWVSEDNPDFLVGMTPDAAIVEMFFETEDNFWSWYYCAAYGE